MYISTTDDLSHTKLALFVACRTGLGDEGGRNLPTKAVQQGAGTAIGFPNDISCYYANIWTADFYSYLLEGYTVEDAAYYACDNQNESSGLTDTTLCGNRNYRIGD